MSADAKVMIALKVPAPMAEQIREAAAGEGRPVGNWVRHIVRRELDSESTNSDS